MDKIEVTRRPYDILRIAPNNTELLRITPTGEVIAPSLEAASEAGRCFVESMRGHLDVIREAICAEITHTQQSDTPVAWMPIESAPHDEEILAAIKVRHADGQKRWERHIIVIDSETGMIRDADFHHGWEAEEYECWQPMPAAPDHIVEPTAMVPDVAALVEALREAREALHFHYTEWDGEPEGAVPLQIARAKCDAALAPFTKGQP